MDQNLPTIRSMARDLEAAKKGQPPPNIPTTLEPPKPPPAPTRPPIPPLPPRPTPPSVPRPEPTPSVRIPPPPATKPAGPAPEPIDLSKLTLPTRPAPSPPRPPLPPASHPSTPIKPLTPPPPPHLPPREELPPRPIPSGRPRRLILLGVVAAAILLFVIGEIWWFFIRPEPEPEVPAETLLPPPEEIVTAPPAEEPTPEPIPADLLRYAKIEDVEITRTSSQAVLAALTDFINRPRGESELVRLVLRLADGRLADFQTLEAALGLAVPVEVSNLFSGEYDFFLVGKSAADDAACQKAGLNTECAGPRLGLALKVSNPATLKPLLSAWEQTIASNLQALIIPKVTIGAGTFSSATYKGVAIRYRNFPLNTTTIDYALAGETLLITTSKNSMFAAINALK